MATEASYPIKVRCVGTYTDGGHEDGDIITVHFKHEGEHICVEIPWNSEGHLTTATLTLRHITDWNWFTERFVPVEAPVDKDIGEKKDINIHDALNNGV